MSGRPRLSPTMDRFLGAQFFGPFVVCLGAFTVAYLIGDVFDRFNDLVHYGGFGLLGLEYFALKIPLIVSQLLPVACLAGVLLGFALLNRSGEVLACQQLGISRLEMAVPVLAVAVLISLFNFALSETVVPLSTRQARYLYEVELKKREIRGVFFAQRTCFNGSAKLSRLRRPRQSDQGRRVQVVGTLLGRHLQHAQRAR